MAPEMAASSKRSPAMTARRDLTVDPVPIHLAGKLNQFVFQIDDLVEPRSEQIARPRRRMLPRPHRPPDADRESCSSL